MSEKELFGFSPEEIDLIRKTVGKEAVNEDELKRFLYRASKMGLNPLDGTVHLLTRNRKNESGKWEKVNVIIVGIDGFRIAAARSGELAGIKRETLHNDKGQLIRAVAEVYRKDWEHPAREVVPYREYCQTKDGKPVGLWLSMPETMLKKCAEAAALRMAFASELAGIYIPEELMRDEDAAPLENEPKKSGRKKATEKAPPETQASARKEVPKENPQKETTEAPKETTPNLDPTEVENFDGELIILESPKTLEHPTFGQYQEILAFSPTAEKTYTLIGKDFSVLKPKDSIHVTGEYKGNKIKPRALTRLTRDEPQDKEAEPPKDATSDVLTVTLTTEPEAGRKTFDGQLEDVLWARAEKDEEKYIIVARGTNKNILDGAKANDTVSVKGEMVSETNGTFVYATEIKAQAAA